MEKWLHRYENQLPDVIPGVPIVELAGNKRVLIENHHGITGYGDKEIVIQVRHGVVCIQGTDLEIKIMNSSQLVITGCIQCIQFLQEG